MNLLIDLHALDHQKAGKAFYTQSLVTALCQLPEATGHTISLIVPQKSNIPVFDFPHVQLIQTHTIGWRFQLSLLRHIWGGSYDVFLSPTSYIPIAFGRGRMISIIYDFAAFQKGSFRKNKKATILEKLLLPLVVRNSEKIITISEYTKKELVKRFPYAAKKTVTILGSARSYGKRVRTTRILKTYSLTNVPYFLFVGTLEPRKNIVGMIHAYALVKHQLEKMNKTVPKLVIVGGKGWAYDDVFNAVKKRNLEVYVQFLGYVPDEVLPALYSHALCFVYVPFYEGFGLPVIEAISYGKAGVVSNTSSLPEVLGPCGISVDPKNPEEVAQALFRMSTNTSMRKKYEDKTASWLTHFSSTHQAHQLIALLSPLL